MAERITIHKEKKNIYDIVIQDQFDSLVSEMHSLGYQGKRICIVTDSNAGQYYANAIEGLLRSISDKVVIFTFPAGEENKSLDVVRQLYRFLIEHKFERRDVLVALGGGVVGDLTGFAAATYLRGIDFIQIPTTLLSQADSSIGGKTGVDFDGYKNMIGAFCMPKLVYMNMHTLDTLDRRIYLSGMGEVIKHGLIRNRNFYEWLKDNKDGVKNRSVDALIHMAVENCRCKGSIVEEDPTEKGIRALLNFGHTIGHAIEKQVHFSLYHGECVAVGMVAAAYISFQKGYLKKEDLEDVEQTLTMYELPIRVKGVNKYDALKATKNDKKMNGGKIRFILLSSIGEAFINEMGAVVNGKLALEVTDEDLIHGLEYIGCTDAYGGMRKE